MERGGPIRVRIDKDLREIVPGYLANRLRDVSSIRHCLEQGDFATIRTIAHQITGSGESYGFLGITSIGRALTPPARASDRLGVEAVVAQLADYLDRLEVYYE